MGEEKEKKEKKSKKKRDKGEEGEGGGGEESGEPKRAQRATSNVFALFNQAQIQEFKEAFTLMDQNRDGFIDLSDLLAINNQLGRMPDEKTLEAMLAEAPGPLNFTMFLSLFGDKLKGTDPEQTLRDAFVMFDEQKTGKLSEEYVKDLLMNTGDQFNKDEIKQTWKEAPIEGGEMDYNLLVTYIKRGKEEA